MADITGLAALQNRIATINRELAARLPGMVMTGAGIVEDEIRARAPVDTGALVRSLDAKADRRKNSASVTVQIEHSDADGAEHYAIFKEYGTSKMVAEPFFRPGVQAAKPKVEQAIGKEIMKILSK